MSTGQRRNARAEAAPLWAVGLHPESTTNPVWQPAWHARFQGLWWRCGTSPACCCSQPLAAIALPVQSTMPPLHPLPVRTRAVRRSTRGWC